MPDGVAVAGIILAVDSGHKKSGVAVGNTFTGDARPLTTIRGDLERQADQVAALCAEWRPALLLFGLPDPVRAKRAHGHCMRLADAVTARTGQRIEYYDENHTTQAAKADKPPASEVDAYAAALLAQDWLSRSPA